MPNSAWSKATTIGNCWTNASPSLKLMRRLEHSAPLPIGQVEATLATDRNEISQRDNMRRVI